MKKIGLICASLLVGLSLAGCNNLASQQAHKLSSSSSSTRVVRHHLNHKKVTKKSKNKKNKKASLNSDQNQEANNATTTQQESDSQPSNNTQIRQNQQSQQSSQENSSSSINNIHDFVNQYGESPAAYKAEHNGMSPEQAVMETPENMETSGEIQDKHLIQQGQDPFQ